MGESSAAAEDRIYSLEQVAEHNSSSDCWLVIGGKVYDVTDFLDDHPGGADVILASTGKDASDDFDEVGHSNSARAMLKDYLIGSMDPCSLPSNRRSQAASVGDEDMAIEDANSPTPLIKFLRFLVPILILCLAFSVRYLTRDAGVPPAGSIPPRQ